MYSLIGNIFTEKNVEAFNTCFSHCMSAEATVRRLLIYEFVATSNSEFKQTVIKTVCFRLSILNIFL